MIIDYISLNKASDLKFKTKELKKKPFTGNYRKDKFSVTMRPLPLVAPPLQLK